MLSNIPLRRLLIATVVLLALICARDPQTPLHAQSSIQVIASGLDNPRGLNFGLDGALYVVEAGRGGTSSLCLPLADAPGIRCYGPSGAVTRITGVGQQQRVVTGLPSLAPAGGGQATGPHDIDFGLNRGWITIGLAANPAVSAPFEALGIRFGTLVSVLPNGQWDYVVDISAYEAAANPDGLAIDSNPYGLRILSDRAIVADAGANAVFQIALNTQISTLGVFPNRTALGPIGQSTFQAVPTTVTDAADGSLLVGQLTGFPFIVGQARVYQLPANGGTPAVVATGFTNIIDIAINRTTGVGYVLEHDADGVAPPFGPGVAGRLIRINANGSQTVIPTPGLIKPGGIAIGPDGALYVTNRSIEAGTGEVVRIVP